MEDIIKKFDLVIFSSGSGSRLRSRAINKPKLLVPINKKTIFENGIVKIAKHPNCRSVVVIGRDLKREKYKKIRKKLGRDIVYLNNRFPKSAHCASSILTASEKLRINTLFINSDLVLSDFNVKKITNAAGGCSKVFGMDQNKLNQNLDLQRLSHDESLSLIEWSLSLKEFNAFVTGPIFLDSVSVKKLVDSLKLDSKENISALPCFTYFSRLIDLIDFKYMALNSTGVLEVDTTQELAAARLKRWVQ